VCYITTGGCVPEGADAVVMVEETQRLSDSRVRILKGASPRQNIREVSSDMAVGDKVLSAGDLVGPAEIGLLATVGAVQPLVRPQVCVGAGAGCGREARPSARHVRASIKIAQTARALSQIERGRGSGRS
jgi:molybdopterin biosynthesis enzyme